MVASGTGDANADFAELFAGLADDVLGSMLVREATSGADDEQSEPDELPGIIHLARATILGSGNQECVLGCGGGGCARCRGGRWAG